MTFEEAGQILLEGKMWLPCPSHGSRTNRCASCDGWRVISNPSYTEACQLLGKPTPTYENIKGDDIPLHKLLEMHSMKAVQDTEDDRAFIIKFEEPDDS